MSKGNENLHKAKKAKQDEFYTQYSDIENELCHYTDHFKGKVVYCNCDDPGVSNFAKYFVDNFKTLGLKKLIVSGYKDQTRDLFDLDKGIEKATYWEYTG